MSSIFKEYLETDLPLLQIIEKHYDPNNFLECVFLEIMKVLNHTVPLDKSLWGRIDLAIIRGHHNTDLFLFFLLNSFAVLENNQEHGKSRTIVSIAESMLNESTPNLLRALCTQILCYPSCFQKKTSEFLRVMKYTTTLAEPAHQRYEPLFHNYFMMLCSFGRLNDLTENENQILNSFLEGSMFGRAYYIKMLNCVTTGDHVVGLKLAKDCRERFRQKGQVELNEYYMKKNLIFELVLKVISGDLNLDHGGDDAIKSLLAVFKNLINDNVDGAIDSYKNYLNTHGENRKGTLELARYIPLHIQFFLGNTAQARKILEDDCGSSDVVYLNDLFLLRILLLEGNHEEAHYVLKRFMENVEKYGAINRVLFELQFAKEFKVGQLFSLFNKWKNLSLKPAPLVATTKEPSKELVGVELLVGASSVLSQVKSLVKRYAPLDETVLIVGETGTGKELVARALHHEGHFSKEPFLAVNCGALTDTLLESELFGYESGAFTGALRQKKGLFESAGKGTVFLDEFGDISPKLQVSLLRVLEYREIRMIGGSENRRIACRIIVATNKNIKQAVDEKTFREDLYYRLTKLEIKLPSLRERLEDLPELVNHFLQNDIFTSKKSVTEDFLNALAKYHWPGNIRELKNGIERLRILNPNKNIFDIDDLDTIQFQGEFSMPEKRPLPQNNMPEKNVRDENSTLHIIREGNLNSKQRLVYMKELFLEHKILTRSQIMKITKTHPTTATKELKLLCDEGFILKKQPSKSSRSVYFELKENT